MVSQNVAHNNAAAERMDGRWFVGRSGFWCSGRRRQQRQVQGRNETHPAKIQKPFDEGSFSEPGGNVITIEGIAWIDEQDFHVRPRARYMVRLPLAGVSKQLVPSSRRPRCP